MMRSWLNWSTRLQSGPRDFSFGEQVEEGKLSLVGQLANRRPNLARPRLCPAMGDELAVSVHPSDLTSCFAEPMDATPQAFESPPLSLPAIVVAVAGSRQYVRRTLCRKARRPPRKQRQLSRRRRSARLSAPLAGRRRRPFHRHRHRSALSALAAGTAEKGHSPTEHCTLTALRPRYSRRHHPFARKTVSLSNSTFIESFNISPQKFPHQTIWAAHTNN